MAVSVIPGWKPRLLVFSCEGSYATFHSAMNFGLKSMGEGKVCCFKVFEESQWVSENIFSFPLFLMVRRLLLIQQFKMIL